MSQPVFEEVEEARVAASRKHKRALDAFESAQGALRHGEEFLPKTQVLDLSAVVATLESVVNAAAAESQTLQRAVSALSRFYSAQREVEDALAEVSL